MGARAWVGLVVGGVLGFGAMGMDGQAPAAASPCAPVRDARGNLVVNTNCGAGTPVVPAAQRFPYPGDPGSQGDPGAVAPGANSPAVPSAGAPATPQPQSGAPVAPASQRFPYPGDPGAPGVAQPGTPGAGVPGTGTPVTGTPGAGAPGGPPLQDAGSSGQSSRSSSSNSSSSSSSSGSSSSDSSSAGATGGSDDPDANDPAAIPRRDRHKKPVVTQTASDREAEDVQVAGFYFNDGNFRGSYDRAREAVTLDTQDAAAFLALGDAARKLGKLDEADKAYRRCLELDPVPKVRKPAEKALREMTGG